MENSGHILVANEGGAHIIKFTGNVRMPLCSSLNSYIERILAAPDVNAVLVDLSENVAIDSTMLGLLAKLSIKVRKKFGIPTTIVSTNPDITRVLDSMGFDQVFVIIDESRGIPPDLEKLPVLEASEEETREHILEAHRTLVNLNESNAGAFREVVEMLES